MIRSTLCYSPLALALQAVLLGGIVGSPSLTVQAAETSQVRHYQLPAAPLEQALNTLAQQAGITLPYDPSLVRGKRAQALDGECDVGSALAHLLAGSGLLARQGSGGNWLLEARSPLALDALELSAVSISGKAPGSITEGTGSYTTHSSSSSTRLNLSLQETPQSITVLTRQRLDDQRLDSLTDVLEATAGITVIRESLGADANSFWSRGFSIANFSIDGVPTSSSLANYRHNTAIYDRVEIVRGSTGLVSGMGTASATINMIRKRPTYEPQVILNAQAGSWDRYGGGLDLSGPLNQSGNLRGRLVADYKSQRAWVDHYEQEDITLYGITELDLSDRTLLTLGFSHQTSNADAPLRSGFPLFYSNGQRTDFKRSANSAPNWSYYDNATNNLFISLEHQFDSGWSAKAEYSHTRYVYDAVVTYLSGSPDQASGAGTSLQSTRFQADPTRQDALDVYLTGPFKLLGREHELIGGVTLSQLDTLNSTDHGWFSVSSPIANIHDWSGNAPKPQFSTYGESDSRVYQYAAYLTTRLHLTDTTQLILGNRVLDWRDNYDYTANNGAKSKNSRRESGVYIPYVGLVQALDDTWSLYNSYTKIFNPQGDWVRDASGNRLAPEEGTSYEAGIKASFDEGRLTSSLSLFRTEQDNLAIYDPSFSAYRTEQGTTTQGFELEINGELTPGWQLSAGYTHSVSTDKNDERIVTQIPRHSLKTFTSYRLPGALDKLTVGGGINWQSKAAYYPDTYMQGSYSLVNLMARYDISENLSASLNLNNLFDKAYYSSASEYGVHGAPRHFLTSLKYTY
ncbi:TonB-dependent siderophore receptor [Pseudomonas sp. ABC1]|uniref:TonB-dependent siderophore receptor n=1 Tax=Pseudomonas sp. ABC1 TaxID=2748080 RepID=UPI0015C3384F|nr:TonB-dependent receptor [Pseudomonas sp. ABC1]QLF91764.1 TonB-dependent siderophore receptor [Pseudomonas sp. ABC1]